jgi:pimeloyl-ACP methyl ester carboxylesterase
MAHVAVSGIELEVDSTANGDPLLLIAGYGCDRTIWSLVAPILAERYRVITFDNRGIGQSSGNASSISIRQMADDAAALLASLGIASAHVAGHSMGGMVAQELTLHHPDKVRSLTLLSSWAQLDARGTAIIESWGDLANKFDAETITRVILPWLYTSAFYNRPGAIEQIIELVLANPNPPSPEVQYQQSRAISASNTSDRLEKIQCSTLVAVGREDILVPIRCSEQLAAAIRGAKLAVLDNTGHGMLIETPTEVANTMSAFLNQLGR